MSGTLVNEDAQARRRYRSILRRLAAGRPAALSAEDVSAPACPPALTAIMEALYAERPERRADHEQLKRGDEVIVYEKRDRSLLAVWRTATGTLAADMFQARRTR